MCGPWPRRRTRRACHRPPPARRHRWNTQTGFSGSWPESRMLGQAADQRTVKPSGRPSRKIAAGSRARFAACMAAAPGRPQSTRHPTAKNTMPEKNRRHLSIHALRWLPISWVLLAILLSASGAHAATIRTLLSTLDAATGNVWANGSYPRYQEFRTGETNVIISDVSVRIFEVFGGGFPRLKLCDSASANCQQLDYQETIGDTYRFTGAYPAYANTSVRIIFDCNCSGSAGYGIYLGPKVIPGASSSAFGYLFAVKVDAIAMPTVNQILPSAGPATGSTPVRLDGTGFLDATGVQFGDTDALHFQVDSDTQITATSPAHSPGAVGIKLMTAANGASTSGSFTYVAAPAITAISPVAGPTAGGSPVTLIGTGFAAAPATGAVRFGAAAAAYTVL
ncbi:hypothetical protein CTI10_003220 [Delftia acidovorans]|nr:hypothetical protein CTI10_003220 [Delftia acidovorans]